MTRRAIALPPAPAAFRPAPTSVPDIGEAVAAIRAAGRQLAELKAQLEGAKRTIAALEIDKRALEREVQALRIPRPVPVRRIESAGPNRSRLDDALAAIAQGLGPSIVRAP